MSNILNEIQLLQDEKRRVQENEQMLQVEKAEYMRQYDIYFNLIKKFYKEKYSNLKIKFENEILKQQIYFEGELFYLSKEFQNDFKKLKLQPNSRGNTLQRHHNKNLVGNYVKSCKLDMRMLIDYMKESLMNSYNTLIGIYDNSNVIKLIENIENQSKNSEKNSHNNINESNNKRKFIEIGGNGQEVSEIDMDLDYFDEYKKHMDDLMFTLDNIELEHLERKDLLNQKKSCAFKLKSKLKYVQQKYESLAKQISKLRYECCVYKDLYMEKKRSQMEISSANNVQMIDDSEKKQPIEIASSDEFCTNVDKSLQKMKDKLIEESGGAISHEQLMNFECDYKRKLGILFNYINLHKIKNGDDCSSSSNSNGKSSNSTTKSSSENNSSKNSSSSNNIAPNLNKILVNKLNCNVNENETPKGVIKQQQQYQQNSANRLIKINVKKIDDNNHNDEEKENNHRPVGKKIENEQCANEERMLENKNLKGVKKLSLNLYECPCDGENVTIENFNLKQDHDVSNWTITRQIDTMPQSTFKIPSGSVIKCGKALSLKTLFNDQFDFLLAIRNSINKAFNPASGANLNLKINTKLLTPDGTIHSTHIQEIPNFYRDVFNYANLIKIF